MVKKTEKKPAKKSTRSVAKKSNKVDYYPNKMTVAISASAAVSLTLLAVIAYTNSI